LTAARPPPYLAAPMAPSVPEPFPRVRAFESLGYGLFLHWGLYSLLERGEWTRHHHGMAAADYRPLAERFTAAEFDAPALVAFAQEAGFRYICLTTRHHDGFSLYDTRGLNRFDAPHSAAGRDLIAEFAAACHAAGMPMFFYHTTLDWEVASFDSDWDGYLSYLRDSVEILCRHYGPVGGFWFDGNWARRDRDWQEDRLYGLIRGLQPEAMLINNSSIGALGKVGHPELDAITFEQGRPSALDRTGAPKYLAQEMCETMNSHWGIAARDYSHKSPAELIRTLAACRGNGANLLLNVGPLASGRLPDYERAALAMVGRWIRTCGESIYEGRPCADLTCRGDDFVMRAGDAWYYFVHHLPIENNMHLAGGVRGDGLQTINGPLPAIARVEWADNGEELPFRQDAAGAFFTFRASRNPYGSQHGVRVARLVPA
jgi:alpha-L-fucosidase